MVSYTEAQTLNFKFEDAGGFIWQTTTLLKQLEEKYNYKYEDISILLIETPSLKDLKYLQQKSSLDSLDHGESESLQLLIVISCWTEEFKHGYHTSIETAKNLSQNNKSFRIQILDVYGNIIKSHKNPISTNMLRKIIKRRNLIKDKKN